MKKLFNLICVITVGFSCLMTLVISAIAIVHMPNLTEGKLLLMTFCPAVVTSVMIVLWNDKFKK